MLFKFRLKILLIITALLVSLSGIVIMKYQIFSYQQFSIFKHRLITKLLGRDQDLIDYPHWQSRTQLFKTMQAAADMAMIGDSITEAGQWSELLANQHILNFGISGDTSYGVSQRLDSIIASHPRQAFIMLGINDIIRGRPLAKICADYTNILQALQQQNVPVTIQSTLYVAASFPNNLAINQQVTQLNQFLWDYTQQHDLIFINLNQYLAPQGVLSPQLSDDGLHLNSPAYQLWQQALIAALPH